MGLLQADWIPDLLGVGLERPCIWVLVVMAGIALGALIGGMQGFVIAFIGIPSFIVTLGRPAHLARRRVPARQRPDDRPARHHVPAPRWRAPGSLGETLSWVVAGIAIVAIVHRSSSPTGAAGGDMASTSARCGPTSRSA